MLKPLKDNVLIEIFDVPEETAGGIVIPQAHKGRGNEGRVEAVGPEVESIKRGARVLLPQVGGNRIKVGEEKELVLIKEDEILAEIV